MASKSPKVPSIFLINNFSFCQLKSIKKVTKEEEVAHGKKKSPKFKNLLSNFTSYVQTRSSSNGIFVNTIYLFTLHCSLSSVTIFQIFAIKPLFINLFGTSKKPKPFKVLHKRSESLLKPFLMVYYFLFITLKDIFSLAFSF